jgi:hypothetical protein
MISLFEKFERNNKVVWIAFYKRIIPQTVLTQCRCALLHNSFIKCSPLDQVSLFEQLLVASAEIFKVNDENFN